MFFWILVEKKNKKTVVEANGRYTQKKDTHKKTHKSQKPRKKTGPIRKKWFFVNPAPTPSTTNVEQKIQDNNNNKGIPRLIFAGKQDNSV